jgi:hypothetical protein
MSDTETQQQAEPIQDAQAEAQTLTPEIVAENNTLSKLPVSELIDIIKETRSEAKTKRLKNRELEGQILEINNAKKLAAQAELEKNSEWEKLLADYKEETKDYNELKDFKAASLEKAKVEVDESVLHLAPAEKELFDLASSKMTYDEQSSYIKKIVSNRPTNTIIDTTQSVGRKNNVKVEDTKNKPVFMGSGNQNSALDTLRALRENN